MKFQMLINDYLQKCMNHNQERDVYFEDISFLKHSAVLSVVLIFYLLILNAFNYYFGMDGGICTIPPIPSYPYLIIIVGLAIFDFVVCQYLATEIEYDRNIRSQEGEVFKPAKELLAKIENKSELLMLRQCTEQLLSEVSSRKVSGWNKINMILMTLHAIGVKMFNLFPRSLLNFLNDGLEAIIVATRFIQTNKEAYQNYQEMCLTQMKRVIEIKCEINCIT